MPELNFNELGFLPLGIHDCSLEEAKQLLCFNDWRMQLWNKFLDYANIITAGGFKYHICLDGSFLTDKQDPLDIDIVLSAVDEFATILQKIDQKYFMHDFVKDNFKLHLFFHPAPVNDFREFFQYIGVKEGGRRGLHPNEKKGILRVIL